MNKEKQKAAQKRYYEKHKEKILAKRREYYWNNKEKEDQRSKEYREKHRDGIVKNLKNYYHANKKQYTIYKRNSKDIWNKNSKIYYQRHKEEIKKRQKERYDPKKNSARGKLHYAIKVGKIQKPNRCQCCGKKSKIEAHHKDYDKPYDVEWLCHGSRHQVIELNEI